MGIAGDLVQFNRPRTVGQDHIVAHGLKDGLLAGFRQAVGAKLREFAAARSKKAG